MSDELSVGELKFLVLLNDTIDDLTNKEQTEVRKGQINVLKWVSMAFMKLRSVEIKEERSASN